MSVFLYEKQHPERYRQSYIAEIKQIKQILFCQPQGNGDRLEDNQYDERLYILSDLIHNCFVLLLFTAFVYFYDYIMHYFS